jgi:hypothetical protein
MVAKERELGKAVITTDVNPKHEKVCIRDVSEAIKNQFGPQARPVSITSFHSDFIIQFATLAERDLVVSSHFLRGHNRTTVMSV